MEEVAASPMVAAALVLHNDNNNNGTDAVSSTAIPSITTSISIEEKQEKEINGDVPATIITTAAGNDDDDELFTTPAVSSCKSPCSTRKTKRGGAFGLFRAMFLSFGRSDSRSVKTIKADGGGGATTPTPRKRATAAAGTAAAAAAAAAAGGDWKSLVDGMRPLRLRGQELLVMEYYPPPPPPRLMGHDAADVYHDVMLPPPSPAPARPGFELAEAGMTSRYASAEDLHQMDSADEEEEGALAAEGGDGDDGDGDGSCPHAIDMQAEEFIAKFYEQFKSESFDRRASG